MQTVTVSVIICSRNRAASLDKTLDSLNTVEVPDWIRPEILVVDNGSTDDTAAVIQKWQCGGIPLRCVQEHRRGQAYARNTGLRSTTSEIIVFTDDDVRFPKDWLDGMCEPIGTGKADAVAGQVIIAPHLRRPWMTLTHRSWLACSERFDVDRDQPVDMIGANMSFRRGVLERIPLFDSELGPGALGYGDDTLFASQITKAGQRVYRSTAPGVVHHFDERRLLRSNWLRAAQDFGRTRAYLYYHWEHGKISFPFYRYCRNILSYSIKRILRHRECSAQEGMPEWELLSLMSLHCYSQYLRERMRPRNYQRYGLVKLQHSVNS